VGQVATVAVPLAPDGRVRVLGEDWAASLASGAGGAPGAAVPAVQAGSQVRIVAIEGLRLLVEPIN
jgi:membrane protein implicated in regulation of membrane protease activity